MTSLGVCHSIDLSKASHAWMRKQSEGSEAAGYERERERGASEERQSLFSLQVVLYTREIEILPAALTEVRKTNSGFRFYIEEPASWTFPSSQVEHVEASSSSFYHSGNLRVTR